MGWGSFKKAWKKAFKNVVSVVTKPVEQAANSTTKAITRGAESVVRRTGMEGTFVGDAIKAAARAYTLPVKLAGGAAAVVGGESAKDVAKGLMVEAMRSSPIGEMEYRKSEKAERQNAAAAEAAARQRRLDDEAALAQAMAKKKAMIAEQESEKARPITDSYLSAGGTLGGYVDAEELKKKKKLGGGK